jgi:hypothetical protein
VEVLGGAVDGVPAVGVGLDAVAHLAAEQPPHRLAERLADDVPARHLHARDAGHDDLAGAAVVAVLHPADEVLDVERVAADDVPAPRLGEVADERVGVAEHPRLADAGEALVRADRHEREVPPRGPQDMGADLGDAQRAAPLESTWH